MCGLFPCIPFFMTFLVKRHYQMGGLGLAISLSQVALIHTTDMFKKFDFELIVIPSRVSDEADFTVITPIYNACEPVYPKIMN